MSLINTVLKEIVWSLNIIVCAFLPCCCHILHQFSSSGKVAVASIDDRLGQLGIKAASAFELLSTLVNLTGKES